MTVVNADLFRSMLPGYFAQGNLYLGRRGSEERMSLVPLREEGDGVVASMHCFEMHDEQNIPKNVDFCKYLKSDYNDYNYNELMNTTFGLVPSGRSPGTYRLGEVMSAGAIPVIVARNTVRPFQEEFDWPSFSFVFSPEEVQTSMVQTLRALSPEEVAEMQVRDSSPSRPRCACESSTSTSLQQSQHVYIITNVSEILNFRKTASTFPIECLGTEIGAAPRNPPARQNLERC